MIRALTHDDYPGSSALTRRRPVNRRQMAAVVRALHDLDLRPSQARRRVGEYELKALFHKGDGYRLPGASRGPRVDAQPPAPRPQLPRAPRHDPRATRPARAPPAARPRSSRASARTAASSPATTTSKTPPSGRRCSSSPSTKASPESLFRLQLTTTFDERMEIIQQIALAYCHGRGVLHRNLSPKSVLVRKPAGTPLEVRLFSLDGG